MPSTRRSPSFYAGVGIYGSRNSLSSSNNKVIWLLGPEAEINMHSRKTSCNSLISPNSSENRRASLSPWDQVATRSISNGSRSPSTVSRGYSFYDSVDHSRSDSTFSNVSYEFRCSINRTPDLNSRSNSFRSNSNASVFKGEHIPIPAKSADKVKKYFNKDNKSKSKGSGLNMVHGRARRPQTHWQTDLSC